MFGERSLDILLGFRTEDNPAVAADAGGVLLVLGAIRDADQSALIHACSDPVNVIWDSEVIPHPCSAKGSEVIHAGCDWGKVFRKYARARVFES